ncbi:oligosaccharide repeat unit polymerase [Haloarcula vallismortis]|uniref:Oligosaccharide repeat unit polymerase n=2 Tax=Haloarcula vallismortis TaxID=28442 RepID=M0JC91_HALVA|nr:O-antigen polymerase [Haloarcula vallismortis]EMA06581.1 hypothetical protein C437_10763 [Haloarcula vallismortis ATCC 29715]SDW60371.1 oligosaccharide repeat unit polymerase [Haloarcula vallismortis]
MSEIISVKPAQVTMIFVELFVAVVGFLVLSSSYPLHWPFIFLLLTLGVFPYAYEGAVGRIDPFSPVMWFAPVFAIVYGIGAARRLLNRDFVFQADYIVTNPETAILKVLILATVGISMLLLGYYRPWGRILATRVPQFGRGWSSRRAWLAIIVTTALGLYGFWLLLPTLGAGPRSHLAKGNSRLAFVLVNLLNVASILLLADAMISAISFNDLTVEIRQPWKLIVTVPFILFNVRLLWLLGGRGRAFSIFVVCAFLIHYLVYQFSLFQGIIIFFGVKIIPAWAADIMSAAVTLDVADLAYHLQNPLLFRESPTRPFNNVVVLISGVPETQDFVYGETFLSAFFEVIPLQPFRETNAVYNAAFYPSIAGDYGVPITMLGELYLNFWLPGVVIGLLLVGVIIRGSYEWLIVQKQSYASIIIFAALTNDFLLMGNFSNSLPGTGMLLVPLFCCLYYVSGGSGSTRSKQKT